MKKTVRNVGKSKVGHRSDVVAPESVEGATLDTNLKTSRGQSPQKGRETMNKKAKKVTVGAVPRVSHEIWKKGSKKIPISITFMPVNGCDTEEEMWIAVAVWCEYDTEEEGVWKMESAMAEDNSWHDQACNAYDELTDKLYNFHDFDGVL